MSDDDGDSIRDLKRMCEDPPSDQCLPCKVRKSKGRAAARDYEESVQQLIKFAIADFHSRLASNYAYPDRVTQVSWAKEAWKEGCKHYDIDMAFNNEIIKMVCLS
jgi:hypothetical protein